MKSYTKYRKELAENLHKVLQNNQEARLVENRYRTLRIALHSKYPSLINNTDKEVMLQFLKDVVYLDRKLRLLTEGTDEEKKEILSQEFQITELEKEPSFNQNVKKLTEIYENSTPTS